MIEINMTENFLKQQIRCLDILSELIVYDKEHGTPPEQTRVLEGFIDTQRRAIDMAKKLLEKHKPALEEAERQSGKNSRHKLKLKPQSAKRNRRKKK